MLRTPVTYESLAYIRSMIKQGTALNSPSKYHFQKLANASEKAFADRDILPDFNMFLFDHKNEKTT
jgi:hypothetical protein